MSRPRQVLPLLCFDPRFLGPSAWGTPKTGAFRAQFTLEAALDLKDRLRGLGSDLLIHLGRPEDVIPGARAARRGRAGRTCLEGGRAEGG